MSEDLTILITCGERDGKELHAELEQQKLGSPMLSQRKGIGGEVASWILVVQALAPVVTSVLTLVASRLGPKRVTKIKVGDVEIENPTQEQLNLLISRISSPPSHEPPRN